MKERRIIQPILSYGQNGQLVQHTFNLCGLPFCSVAPFITELLSTSRSGPLQTKAQVLDLLKNGAHLLYSRTQAQDLKNNVVACCIHQPLFWCQIFGLTSVEGEPAPFIWLEEVRNNLGLFIFFKWVFKLKRQLIEVFCFLKVGCRKTTSTWEVGKILLMVEQQRVGYKRFFVV